MEWTDDPIADAERYFNEQEEALEKLPRCSQCDCHIQDEYAYYINDEWVCESCMGEFRRDITEYTE